RGRAGTVYSTSSIEKTGTRSSSSSLRVTRAIALRSRGDFLLRELTVLAIDLDLLWLWLGGCYLGDFIHDVEWLNNVRYVVSTPSHAVDGLRVLLVSEGHVVDRQNLANNDTTRGSFRREAVNQKSHVGRLSSGRVIRRNVAIATRGHGSPVEGVTQVLKSWLSHVGLNLHVTLNQTTSGNVYDLVYLKLLVLLVNGDLGTIGGSTEVTPARCGYRRSVSRLLSSEWGDVQSCWALH